MLFIHTCPFHPCRRISTDAAKQWLCKLKEEEVPNLVCLTHADRLYADLIPKDKSETLEPTGFKQRQIGRELQVQYVRGSMFAWLL